MPTYEYECKTCAHHFEQYQSINDKPLCKCPKCGKPRLARLIGTGGAVIFKGSGFYQTDYRSKSYTSAKKADSPSPAAPAASKSEPKSAASSAAKTKD